MTPSMFLESPECIRLGWTLLHSLWQLAAIGCVGAVVLALARTNARTRYVLAYASLLLMAAAPIATFLFLPPPMDEPRATLPPPPPATFPVETPTVDEIEYATAAIDGTPPPIGVLDGDFAEEMAETVEALAPPIEAISAPPIEDERAIAPMLSRWSAWLVPFWLLGVVLLAVRHLGGWLLTRRLLATAGPIDHDAMETRLGELARAMGVHAAIRVLRTALADVPMVVGWLRPALLIPLSLATSLSPEQWDAVLAHELAHIRRRDYLMNLVQIAIETLLFYHPAAWLLSRRIRIEREHCCDDLAADACGSRIALAEALAAIEAQRARSATGAAMAASGGGSTLQRVRRILQFAEPTERRWNAWIVGAAVLIALASWAALGQTPPSDEAIAATPAEEAEDDESLSSDLPEGADLASFSAMDVEIRGRVVDHDGKPVEGAQVLVRGERMPLIRDGKLRDSGDRRGAVATDADGRFTVSRRADSKHLLVTTPKLDAWRVPIPKDDAEGDFTIRLPEPATLEIVMDIRGAIHGDENRILTRDASDPIRFEKGVCPIRLRLNTEEMDGWEQSVDSVRYVGVENPGKVTLEGLTPGRHDVSRCQILEIAGYGRGMSLDKQTVELAPGETKTIRLVRDRGRSVQGRLGGLPEDSRGAYVVVRPTDVSADPRVAIRAGQWRLPTLDGLTCERDATFQTALLAPGEYKLIAHAYAPDVASSPFSGIPLPEFVGESIVTIDDAEPDEGNPIEVEIDMVPLGEYAEAADEADAEAIEAFLLRVETPVPPKQGRRKLHTVDEQGRITELRLRGVMLAPGDSQVIGRMRDLVLLDLSETNISDDDIKHLAGLPRLEELNLFETKIDGSTLAELAPLTKLERLNVGDTLVTDAALPEIAKLGAVRHLNLCRTPITDGGLARLSTMKELRTLKLGETAVTDEGIASLAPLEQLSSLCLDQTAVTLKGLEQAAGMPKLGWIDSPVETVDELVRRMTSGDLVGANDMVTVGLLVPMKGTYASPTIAPMEVTDRDRERGRRRFRIEVDWGGPDVNLGSNEGLFLEVAIDRGAVCIFQQGLLEGEP